MTRIATHTRLLVLLAVLALVASIIGGLRIPP
jgi:hypothetical protein